MLNKEEATAIFSTEYEVWAKSQEGQTDAYAYEASFVEFIQRMSRQVLQASVGQEADKRKKKRYKPDLG
jgi:hypothetical protein